MMGGTGSLPFTPIAIPAGQLTRWEWRFQGRMRWELDDLQSHGITPEVDWPALQNGSLLLRFDWPLDSATIVRLETHYPDEFPYMRPEVFLVSGVSPRPVRHINPVDGKLCLLGRDTRQWKPSWTLYQLLSEQLSDALSGSGEEDPQGEPADVWWNSLAIPETYCLVDSAWDLHGAREGVLAIQCRFNGYRDLPGGGQYPHLQAAVREVRDSRDQVLHVWNGQLPPKIAGGNHLEIRWVWSETTIYPSAELGEQARALRESSSWLRSVTPQKFGSNVSAALFAVAHPVELTRDQTGVGWVFFFQFGKPSAFQPMSKAKVGTATLQALRAGPRDIGFRSPAVQVLQQSRILLVGTGAIGAPVAVDLARNGCKALHLVDDGIIEPGNSVRWPLGASAWGLAKVDALAAFLEIEYSMCRVHAHRMRLGGIPNPEGGIGEGTNLETILGSVDLVVDASASFGVALTLAHQCRDANVPLISLFATPTLSGGCVSRFGSKGGCPNCLEWAWHLGQITDPRDWADDTQLAQPPGCAERTFVGASFDLQELSLQAMRLICETLRTKSTESSVVHTLSFDGDGGQTLPVWRLDPLPILTECGCRP